MNLEEALNNLLWLEPLRSYILIGIWVLGAVMGIYYIIKFIIKLIKLLKNN